MSKRLFIAVDISDKFRSIASRILRDLCASGPTKGISLVKPENLHVTIKFLGEMEEPTEGKLTGLLTDIASQFPPFRLKIYRIELLGKRVISMKIAGDTPTLFDLEKRLDVECESLGFKREGRRFHPHLTLARIRDRRNAHAVIREFSNVQVEPVEFDVRELVLYESRLTPSGPVYSKLGVFALQRSRFGVPPSSGSR